MGTDIIRKSQAIELRRSGQSIKSIAYQLSAAQSSVSIWVKGVKLSENQRNKLKQNTHSPETVEKRKQTRLKNEKAKREIVINSAQSIVGKVTEREMRLIGSALYWAEGSKSKRNVQFTNGDPNMIKLMMHFFRDVCKVREEKFRCHIHIHESLDVEKAEKHWQKITGIKKSQFYPTYNKPNKSSKGTRNSLPYGVCGVHVLDTHLFLNIQGWTRGIYKSVLA
jgi:hypothetical protein